MDVTVIDWLGLSIKPPHPPPRALSLLKKASVPSPLYLSLHFRRLAENIFPATFNYRHYFTNLFSSQNLKGIYFQVVSLLIGLDLYQSTTCLYTQRSIKVDHLHLVLVINASLCV